MQKIITQPQNIFSDVRQIISSAIAQYTTGQDLDFSVEYPKDPSCGHFATNVAMMLTKHLKQDVRQIAVSIATTIAEHPVVQNVQVAGPGFINITLKASFWYNFITLSLHPTTVEMKSAPQQKILVEFVSANPTGPMHVGHCRGAIFGDVLCNILESCGYDVTRQYYINDAGEQIKTLINSLYIRYQQVLGHEATMPESGYPGEYLIDMAQDLKRQYADALLNQPYEEISISLSTFAVNKVMQIIKKDLTKLGALHNSFVSELHDIQQKGFIQKAVAELQKRGLLYEGTLEAPKGIEANNWHKATQLIFKSTDFGDDADRVVQREDGSYTYFAGDLGLALYRAEQGYDKILMVLGADHIGFIKRLEAIMQAFAPAVDFKVTTTQMVNLFKDGTPFKMSKRAGNFITAEDVVNEVGADALRFAMLWRKNDTVIDFDFESVKQQNKDNPIFYVQYAHARAASVLAMASKEMSVAPGTEHVNLLTDFDWDLVRKTALLPRILEQAAKYYEPHRLVHFLYELATEFHAFWAKGNSELDLRFIVPHNCDLTNARLAVVQLVKNTIYLGLKILGVEALEQM
jgi:arginyl-tRNA synthetase